MRHPSDQFRQKEGNPGGGNDSPHKLAFGADIPEQHAKGDAHGQARKHKGDGAQKRLANVVALAERPRRHGCIGLEWIGAEYPQQDAAEDERQTEGNQWKRGTPHGGDGLSVFQE